MRSHNKAEVADLKEIFNDRRDYMLKLLTTADKMSKKSQLKTIDKIAASLKTMIMAKSFSLKMLKKGCHTDIKYEPLL
jgi:hypothetical protein